MKRKLLRLLPVAAVLLTASCIDDKYDLRDVDTTSRFPAKDLVIPLNLDTIKLDAIISVDNNEGDVLRYDINTGNFYFNKKGTNLPDKDYCFESDPIRVEKITIQKPAEISESITIDIPDEIINKWEQYAPDKTIYDILQDASLMSQIGITPSTDIINLDVTDTKTISMSAVNIDNRITSLKKLGVDPVSLNIDVKLNALTNVVDKTKGVTITNLSLELPRGLNVTDNENYNSEDGKLNYAELTILNGQKVETLTVDEFNYETMQKDGAKFDAQAHTFIYNKACKVTGHAKVKVEDLDPRAKVTDLKSAQNATTYSCDVYFSNDLVVNKFSGGIDYALEEDIDIEPFEIDDLPEFIEDLTDIELDNPQIYLTITNPFFDNGIRPTSTLIISAYSDFKHKLNLQYGKENKIILAPNKPKDDDLLYKDYTYEEFEGLGKILSGEDGIPDMLMISVEKPLLKSDEVTDFELGKDLAPITGSWEFYSKLSLPESSSIQYKKVWEDWGSEDLDGLTIEKAIVEFNVKKKDFALDADEMTFKLHGKVKDEKGNLKDGYLVNKETIKLTGDEQTVKVEMVGGPLSHIEGGELVVKLKGQGKELNVNDKIEISNLRLTVSGYYDKEL